MAIQFGRIPMAKKNKKKRKVMDLVTYKLKFRFLAAKKKKKRIKFLARKTKKLRPDRVKEMGIVGVPDDVIPDILVLLPTKSLMRLKSVCKLWKTIISGPRFAESHHEQSKARPEASCMWLYIKTNSSTLPRAIFPVDPDGTFSKRLKTYNFRGSIPCSDIVNGMVCVCGDINDGYQLHLLNLTSGETIPLPKPRYRLNSWWIQNRWSFHILCMDNKYKVLFVEINPGRYVGNIEILTLGTRRMGWRKDKYSSYQNGPKAVKFFDFRNEKFFQLKLPEGVDGSWELARIGDDVGLVRRKSYNPCVFKVWRYESRVKWWTKYEVNLGKQTICNVKFIGQTRKSSEILPTGHKSRNDPVLRYIFFDFETGKCSRPSFEVTYPGTTLCCHGVSPAVSHHVENILPLRSLIESENYR
ncbi:OLC1v1008098C1 [Oldenlandia corymbosa var. corymbosa]|uniref:OLC1v1008098C1 n=1 Tax=Oldenlandia corymbosa var. corymbosa TaxID=529605 RepID=A0AAV1DLB2_OLDCO|nr:OLC1v1008098C1 [Oldenlandia corymbosa var. corymbosa]